MLAQALLWLSALLWWDFQTSLSHASAFSIGFEQSGGRRLFQRHVRYALPILRA